MTKSPSILSVGSTQSIAEELSLFDFMSKYSRSLPHRVKVCKGFYGVSERTAVTTGDLLNLHFLKSTKVGTKPKVRTCMLWMVGLYYYSIMCNMYTPTWIYTVRASLIQVLVLIEQCSVCN